MTPTITVTAPSKTQTSSPLHAYHSNVMQAMCTQMVHHRRRSTAVADDLSAPLPLAKTPLPTSKAGGSMMGTRSSTAQATSKHQSNLKDHVREEMARRAKADRVLQDLSSDKSRQQARARETQRRNKWAKSIASACPPATTADVAVKPTATKKSMGLGGGNAHLQRLHHHGQARTAQAA